MSNPKLQIDSQKIILLTKEVHKNNEKDYEQAVIDKKFRCEEKIRRQLTNAILQCRPLIEKRSTDGNDWLCILNVDSDRKIEYNYIKANRAYFQNLLPNEFKFIIPDLDDIEIMTINIPSNLRIYGNEITLKVYKYKISWA